MKGNANVIKLLNEGLSAELTAINQYFVTSKMCANWGFLKLAKKNYEESIEEMKHAELFIDRILFLDGVPNMQKYGKIEVGTTVQEQLENDLRSELEAIDLYNRGVEVSRKAGDNGSASLFEQMLKDEEGHVDYLEAQLHTIGEIGIENYLAQQL